MSETIHAQTEEMLTETPETPADAPADAVNPETAEIAADAGTGSESTADTGSDAASEGTAGPGADAASEGTADTGADAASESMADAGAGKAPETSVETMADYEAEISASFKPIHEGDILTGTVIGISEEEVVLDFGSYTDGVLRLADASDDPSFTFNDIEMGQKLSVTVIRRDNGEGRLQLSMKEATAILAWDRLQQMMEDKTAITVKIGGIVKGGAIAYLEGIRGFIPASKLSLEYVEDLDTWLGKEITVRVITADPEAKRLVLSAREILREKAAEERKQRISNVQIGLVTEGVVESLMPYGAFVRLGNGLSGLVHVSQISQQRIKHPGVVLKEGQTVKVKIIGVKDGKISLSMKALEDVAAAEIEEETYQMPKAGEATTSLASLFKNIKL